MRSIAIKALESSDLLANRTGVVHRPPGTHAACSLGLRELALTVVNSPAVFVLGAADYGDNAQAGLVVGVLCNRCRRLDAWQLLENVRVQAVLKLLTMLDFDCCASSQGDQ